MNKVKKVSKQGTAVSFCSLLQLLRHEHEDLTLPLEETSGKLNVTLIVKS